MNRAPFFWDECSDQPQVIKDKSYKKTMRKKHMGDFIKMMLTALFILPFCALVMKFFKGRGSDENFYGIGVNLDKGDEQIELVEELGVKNLIIRFPLWEMQNLALHVEFVKKFKDKQILLNIMQDREHIENIELLKDDLTKVFSTFVPHVNEFQVGTTINRAKWGFFSVSEYLAFYKVAQDLRDKSYPHVKLLGPSVIDFEYYYNARAMFNANSVKFDKVSALLYVDRRGAPSNTQYLFFDTKNKIDLLYALARLSPKSSDEIYITETNWPLSNTAPYAPTSEKECVSCEEYSRFMREYHEILKQSGKIKRVYWHQLVAPGYGLVDNRDGKMVKLPQYYEYKKMIKGEM